MLPENLTFFLDDEYASEPFTTSNLWALKRHNTIIYGYRDVMVRNLDEFILYREKVGTFPIEPPQWWKPNPANRSNTALRAAFEESAKHLRRDNGQPFGGDGPASLYQKVLDGSVMDRDTSLIRQAEMAKHSQSGKQ
jgi:hypothetical protein